MIAINFKVTAFLIIISLFFVSIQLVFAQQDNNIIEADVKISICGNEIVEGGEECDNQDLNDQTCQTLGYAKGILTCDIACDFDTSDCSGIFVATPTPTIVPTSTPTPTPTPLPTSIPTPGSISSVEATPIPQLLVSTPTPMVVEILVESLASLQEREEARIRTVIKNFFDLDNSGKIEKNELKEVIKIWVDEWKGLSKTNTKCDINKDEGCDLTDLSILLFYVEN